jgi:phenylpyruvate tautomerase PptA (4-oxalocrotonate tautomerase family)
VEPSIMMLMPRRLIIPPRKTREKQNLALGLRRVVDGALEVPLNTVSILVDEGKT